MDSPIVSNSRPSLMIIGSRTQFHVERLNPCLAQCLKCESGRSHFQPGEGPSIVGAFSFSMITNLWMDLFEALTFTQWEQSPHFQASISSSYSWANNDLIYATCFKYCFSEFNAKIINNKTTRRQRYNYENQLLELADVIW